jgi:hypothetical protein
VIFLPATAFRKHKHKPEAGPSQCRDHLTEWEACNCGGLACNTGDLRADGRYLSSAKPGTDFAARRSDGCTNLRPAGSAGENDLRFFDIARG